MMTIHAPIGPMIREWRTRRRLSQLDLALEAEISQRHLSFVENGRAAPSRDMILNLCERLSVPLRQRNRMLLAAGFAPRFGERDLGDPSLSPALDAVRRVLDAHAPNPAIAVDRHWTMVAGNAAMEPFLAMVEDRALVEPPVNVLRASLHPKGLAPLIDNLAEWRAHLLDRLRRQNDIAADPRLTELERELSAYPAPAMRTPLRAGEPLGIAVPLVLRAGATRLSFISTITVFGTPLEVTLSELAIESFFPADAQTAEALRRIAPLK